MHRYFKALSEDAEVRDLPDHLAIEVMAENLLNGGTRNYSPHSHIIRGLGSEYAPDGTVRPLRGLRCYDGDERLLRFFGHQQSLGLMVHPNTIETVIRWRFRLARIHVGGQWSEFDWLYGASCPSADFRGWSATNEWKATNRCAAGLFSSHCLLRHPEAGCRSI